MGWLSPISGIGGCLAIGPQPPLLRPAIGTEPGISAPRDGRNVEGSEVSFTGAALALKHKDSNGICASPGSMSPILAVPMEALFPPEGCWSQWRDRRVAYQRISATVPDLRFRPGRARRGTQFPTNATRACH
jgi:hypothetical protein